MRGLRRRDDPRRVRAIADRHTGIGCDQLVLIGTGTPTDLTMRIFNADGGEVEACGNATRCVPMLLGARARSKPSAGILDAARAARRRSIWASRALPGRRSRSPMR